MDSSAFDRLGRKMALVIAGLVAAATVVGVVIGLVL